MNNKIATLMYYLLKTSLKKKRKTQLTSWSNTMYIFNPNLK